MKKVESYQTADDRLFTDKAEALKHEFSLEVKGFMQPKNRMPPNGVNSMTVQNVSDTICRNFDEFAELLMGYKRKASANARKPYGPRKAKTEAVALQVV